MVLRLAFCRAISSARRQLPVGGGDVQVQSGAVVHRRVQGDVTGPQGAVVGAHRRQRRVQRFAVPSGG